MRPSVYCDKGGYINEPFTIYSYGFANLYMIRIKISLSFSEALR